MNKEQLVELGLNDEQISELFKIRGKEIEANKLTVSSLEESKVEAENRIKDMEENYVSRDDLNLIKIEKEELSNKLEDVTKTHQGELQAIQYDFTLDGLLRDAGARDASLVKNVLDRDKLEFEDGEIIGFDDEISSIKESYDYLFKSKDNDTFFTGKHGDGLGINDKQDPFLKGFNS